MDNIKLINLSTGEVLNVDPYKLKELGVPVGFVIADDVTVDDWIDALQTALENI